MSAQDPLVRQATIAAILLIVSGLTAVTLRRHLVVNLLGLHLLILGGAMLMAKTGPGERGRTAAVLLAASSMIAPIGLAGAVRWRQASGAADPCLLHEDDEESSS